MSPAADLWSPTPGRHLESLVERSGLPEAESRRIASDTLRVLGRCRPPVWGEEGASAELVVGAVQSGKTLSFTALIAAARDNGFPLIIVLAGTKTNLRDQTYERLVRDLQMNGDGGLPSWAPQNGLSDADVAELTARVEQWTSHGVRNRVTTVAVVLKNHISLRRAKDVLESLTRAVPGVPVLFVDDEADQAGMNVAARKGKESSTYRAIRLLRESVPNHSYVLYTATPQAPLLITLTDSLSPRTVSVLGAGPDYVGGEELFESRYSEFVRHVPDLEDALDGTAVSPPASLERAIATFLLAMMVAQRRDRPKPLSMLIHPAAQKEVHSAYERWTTGIKHRLSLSLTDGDEILRQNTVSEIFKPAYEDLRSTGGVKVDGADVPLDDLVDGLAAGYLDTVRVRVVNSETGNEILPGEWTQAPGWIVIGGNKLDRGYTVTNLAVTYMPRGPGVRNADTVQQRGRFFGYKRSYVDLLRAWLDPDTAKVFADYVRHERTMREALEALDREGRELASWRRSLLLDGSLNPTRREVITLDVDDVRLRGWVLVQTHLYADAVGPTPQGRSVLDGLRAEAVPDSRDRRPETRNTVVRTTWEQVAPVLADWRATSGDKGVIYSLMLALGTLDDAPPVDLVFMNGGRTRTRGPSVESRKVLERTGWDRDALEDLEALEVGNLMQGPDPADGSRYPGDRAFSSSVAVTVQVHELSLEAGPGRYVPATAVAVHVPEALGDRVILQA
jgi:Z1 domain.